MNTNSIRGKTVDRVAILNSEGKEFSPENGDLVFASFIYFTDGSQLRLDTENLDRDPFCVNFFDEPPISVILSAKFTAQS